MFDRFAHMAKAMYGALASGGFAMLAQSVGDILADGNLTIGEALAFLAVALTAAGLTGKVVYRVTNSNVTPARIPS